MRLIHLFPFIAVLSACSGGKVAESAYFDSKTFFEQQVQQLSGENYSLQKELLFNNKRESVKNDTVNWEKELDAFSSIDLRKPSYNGRFSVDTTFSGADAKITYTSEDPHSDLRSVILDLSGDHIRSSSFIFAETNSLYKSDTKLIFYTDSAYTIEGKQSVRSGNDLSYKITARFLNP